MTVSRECEYSIQGLIHLAPAASGNAARRDPRRARAPQECSRQYLSEIDPNMVRSVLSWPPTRGYTLSRSAGEISLRGVLEAIEGAGLFEPRIRSQSSFIYTL